ncbi:nitroreductase/quinone reductase family protein [Nocardia sp. bgisy118]|uniref:nitroreductase/quinone reductase family protein n=1 Tax=Nocardia sp. bgisy118 TaxID=3413786 RepID=UPI003F49D836
MAQDTDAWLRKVKRFNKVIIWLQKMGIALGPHHLITTTGHRTGQPRIAAIGVIPIAGQRYIFQAYPKAAWVANVRAAQTVTLSRGRRSSVVKLVELPVEERRPILRDHIANSHARVGNLFVTTGLVEDPTPQAVADAADRIAVFRIEAQP